MTAVKRVAVTGAAGQLGKELVRAFTDAGASVAALMRPAFDLADPMPALDGVRADILVNAAAWTDVDGCARDPELAMALNGTAVGVIAAHAAHLGARLVQISTNEVFDGAGEHPYTEDDDPNPINAYGRSKLLGETLARIGGEAVVVRTAWIYGGPRSFPAKILAAARRARESGTGLRVVSDEIGNPTPASALAERVVMLSLRDALPPTVHLAGEPPVSRHEWATRILAKGGIEAPAPMASRDYMRASTPPLRAVLDTSLATALGLPRISWIDLEG